MANTYKLRHTGAEVDSKLDSVQVLLDSIADINRQLDDIRYDEIAVNSFTNNVNKAENGQTITSIRFNWSTNKTPTTVTCAGVEVDPTLTTYTINDAQLTKDSTVKKWELVVTDERNYAAKKTTSITFMDRVYYGVAEEPEEYTSDFIRSLANKPLSTEIIKSFDASANSKTQYVYYCVPTYMKECTFNVGGWTGGVKLIDTVMVKNEFEHDQQYYVYRTDNAGIGTKTFIVSTKGDT
jgi:hypothetical protein